MATRKPLFDAVILAFSLLFSLAVCEAGYRVWLATRLDAMNPFTRVSKPSKVPATFSFQAPPGLWVFNREYGWDYRPEGYLAGGVRDGRLENCGWNRTFNSRGNIASEESDLIHADIKGLLIGSSYTMGNIEGRMFNELLGDELAKRTGKKVVIENFGRDSFGVIQMMDMAPTVAERYKPDFIVIAFNSATIAMPRHWRHVRHEKNGFYIFYQINEPTNRDLNSRNALPHRYVISDKVTPEWCARMTAAATAGDAHALAEDPAIKAMIEWNEEETARREAPKLDINLWRLDRSFLYRRIVSGNAFHGLDIYAKANVLNPLAINDYGDDPGFRSSLARLKASRIPFILVHIPSYPEIKTGREWDAAGAVGGPETREMALVKSLERHAEQPIESLLPRIRAPRKDAAVLAEKADNPDPNWHPSRKGIEAFVPAIADIVMDKYFAAR